MPSEARTSEVRTRIAPSPTGDPHVGTGRQEDVVERQVGAVGQAHASLVQVELQVRVAPRRFDDLRDRLLGEWSAPQVRMDDHARRVEDAAKAGRTRGPQLRGQPFGEVAWIRARANLLAREIEHGPRRVDGERIVQHARELVHRRKVAQLHDR